MLWQTKIRFMAGLAVAALAVGAASYGLSDAVATEQTPALAAPVAVPVDIVTVEKRPVRLWRPFSARLQAVDEVNLRPQVSGTIVEVRFRDGQTVAEGDVLFVIDPRPFKAAVAQVKADLGGARERFDFADRELARARQLVRSSTIAERVVDQRENEFANARSQVQAAAARLAQAEIDLDHAYVKAPIGGRVSRAEVTVGNLVQAGSNAPLLTTIVSNRGIYADFDVDEATYLRTVREVGATSEAERAIPVRLAVGADGESEVYEGRIHAFDNQIDPQTGTIRARALFANDEGHLLPGMFATVKMGSAIEHDLVLLSERAIMTDQDRRFVYVVDDGGKAAYREVHLGAAVSGKRVITAGLGAGDRVIVGGTMMVRPSTPVAPRNVAQGGTDEAPARVAAGG